MEYSVFKFFLETICLERKGVWKRSSFRDYPNRSELHLLRMNDKKDWSVKESLMYINHNNILRYNPKFYELFESYFNLSHKQYRDYIKQYCLEYLITKKRKKYKFNINSVRKSADGFHRNFFGWGDLHNY